MEIRISSSSLVPEDEIWTSEKLLPILIKDLKLCGMTIIDKRSKVPVEKSGHIGG